MQALFEFFPLILFFAAYLFKDLYFAVAVLMVAMPIGLAVKYFRTRRLDRIYLWSTVFLLIAGAATLYFRNPQFLYWKPTAFYWALAAAFIVSGWVSDRPFVRRLFELTGELPTDKLDNAGWKKLNYAWSVFFILMGALNIYVAYHYPERTWVNFKVFGLMGISIVFMVAQGMWLFSRLGVTSESSADS